MCVEELISNRHSLIAQESCDTFNEWFPCNDLDALSAFKLKTRIFLYFRWSDIYGERVCQSCYNQYAILCNMQINSIQISH